MNRIFIKGERLLQLVNCPESATLEEVATLARNIMRYRNEQDNQKYNIQKEANNASSAMQRL